MKKYIIPAVEVIALRSEFIIAASFVVNSEFTVGGESDQDASGGIGQLANRFDWDSADWSE